MGVPVATFSKLKINCSILWVGISDHIKHKTHPQIIFSINDKTIS